MMVYVRKEQVELMLKLRQDVETAQRIAAQAQARLDLACASVLAGIVGDGAAIQRFYVEGDRGIVLLAPEPEQVGIP